MNKTESTPEPGIHEDVSFDTYCLWDAVNHSKLKGFSKSAAHARRSILNPPEPTRALEAGRAIHAILLQPDLLDSEFVVAPKLDRRSKAGKEAWANFESMNQFKTIITPDEHEMLTGIRDSVWGQGDTAITELLSATGKNEVCAVWDDNELGVRCKARLDRFTLLNGWPCVVDLKSTRDADRHWFSKDLYRLKYHTQAAYYIDGLKALHDVDRRFVIVALEKDEPYCCVAYELEADAIEQGRRTYRKWLRQYVEATTTGVWAGYSTQVEAISLPAYAFDNSEGM